ncbi:8-oxo-dGTP diphosphatase [Rubritalea squalenifaciens DSM 18772]|uniref:8-oxo-dGTP diphosphatase n=1 Tax=Rubritalea squalenifaciens DSM 18772 TaxID=1123071 RepID=A0A1M6AXN2_9BACT|nr:NUDIX domain-containing protein [Rubritalea squalenifaciens]SHI41235.1 8-oxo-dGTP diphosphatase [Rubritalea squalenifaciens DSM 18772]
MPVSYEYERPALTVDCVLFGLDEEGLKVLLIRRGMEPYQGKWALPGGFVRVGEALRNAAERELEEEAGVKNVFLEQLYTFGDPGRDPREHVVSVAYYALVNLEDHEVVADTDASDAGWFALDDLPGLAFDHEEILEVAKERLKGKIRYQPIGFELLPELFSLSRLQKLYEAVLERPLDKRNFRKKLLKLGILEETDEVEKDVARRAARLYRFDREAYDRMVKEGFELQL